VNFRRSIIVVELWRPEVAKCWNCEKCLRFVFGKNEHKFCSESFHRDTDRRVVLKFREIWPTWNRWNRALFTGQKFACLSNCRYCADRAQNLQGRAPDNVRRMLQISSKSVHFRRSNITERVNTAIRALKWIQSSAEAYSFQPNKDGVQCSCQDRVSGHVVDVGTSATVASVKCQVSRLCKTVGLQAFNRRQQDSELTQRTLPRMTNTAKLSACYRATTV